MEFIHSSWENINLTSFHLIYNSIIENLSRINVEYEPKDTKDILYFLRQDITNLKIIYIKYNRNTNHFSPNEKLILSNYLKDKKIISIPFNLTATCQEDNSICYEKIWVPLIKELLMILSNKVIFIHIEKNALLTRNMYNSICPDNIMKFNYEMKMGVESFYETIEELYDLKNTF